VPHSIIAGALAGDARLTGGRVTTPGASVHVCSMTPEIAAYFTAERRGGFLLVAMAIAGFALAAFLWRTQSAFLGDGMAPGDSRR
jgi:hypothetical protein